MATARTARTARTTLAELLVRVVLLALWLLPARPAAAHGMRLGMLRIDEVGPGRAVARWTATVAHTTARPAWPAGCTATPIGDGDANGDAVLVALACPGGVVGRTLGVAGLGGPLTEATIVVRFADGRTASHLVTAAAPRWTLPADQGAAGVAASYVAAGLVHIATGADHVLFLVLLALALRRVRAVVMAETAFTLSHSLAFAATALGWIRIAAAPAEACIALSLVLLALDVGAEPGMPAARGAALALVFGAVHGLGFAGGLRELGVPDAHAAWALIGFGAGVELGQLAVLAAVLVAIAGLARTRAWRWLVPLGALGVGAVATAWLIERLIVSFRG